MSAVDCLIGGCRWGDHRGDRCECAGVLTAGDVMTMRFAAEARADEVDFSPYYEDDPDDSPSLN